MTNRPLWTIDDVKYRLAEAAKTLKAVPMPKGARPREGYGSGWPDIVRDAKEAYGYDPSRANRFVPTNERIAHMEEAIEWLLWIEETTLPIVWGRASGVTWRRLEDIDGRSKPTLKKLYDLALATIQVNLNRKASQHKILCRSQLEHEK